MSLSLNIPSRDQVRKWLPEEYTQEQDLFNEELLGENSLEKGSTCNRLLLEREKLFSDEGYHTQDDYENLGKLWARFHLDKDQEPNGLIITYVSKNYLLLWKSGALIEENQIQAIRWNMDSGFEYDRKSSLGKIHSVLKQVLLEKPYEGTTDFQCEITEAGEEDIRKIREFCGNSRPFLPKSLKDRVFPEQESYWYRVGFVAISLLTIAFAVYKLKAGAKPSTPELPSQADMHRS